jgi:hypothetical protein
VRRALRGRELPRAVRNAFERLLSAFEAGEVSGELLAATAVSLARMLASAPEVRT